jgi:ferredoxin
MGIFIKLEIDQKCCLGVKACGQCIKVCPVKIFGQSGDWPRSLDENEDECTLCALCLVECKPDAVHLRKLYDCEGPADILEGRPHADADSTPR